MKKTKCHIYYYYYHYVLKCKNEKCIWKIFVKYTQIRQSNTNTNISSCGFSNTNTNTDICVFKYKYKYVFDPSPDLDTYLNTVRCQRDVMSSMKAETPVIRSTAHNLLLQWMEYLLLQLPLIEPKRDFAELYQSTVYSRYITVGGVQAMVPRYKWERDISGDCHMWTQIRLHSPARYER